MSKYTGPWLKSKRAPPLQLIPPPPPAAAATLEDDILERVYLQGKPIVDFHKETLEKMVSEDVDGKVAPAIKAIVRLATSDAEIKSTKNKVMPTAGTFNEIYGIINSVSNDMPVRKLALFTIAQRAFSMADGRLNQNRDFFGSPAEAAKLHPEQSSYTQKYNKERPLKDKQISTSADSGPVHEEFVELDDLKVYIKDKHVDPNDGIKSEDEPNFDPLAGQLNAEPPLPDSDDKSKSTEEPNKQTQPPEPDDKSKSTEEPNKQTSQSEAGSKPDEKQTPTTEDADIVEQRTEPAAYAKGDLRQPVLQDHSPQTDFRLKVPVKKRYLSYGLFKHSVSAIDRRLRLGKPISYADLR